MPGGDGARRPAVGRASCPAGADPAAVGRVAAASWAEIQRDAAGWDAWADGEDHGRAV